MLFFRSKSKPHPTVEDLTIQLDQLHGEIEKLHEESKALPRVTDVLDNMKAQLDLIRRAVAIQGMIRVEADLTARRHFRRVA